MEKLQTQNAVYGKSLIASQREEFIWSNKWIRGELPNMHLELAGITYSHEQYQIIRKGDPYQLYDAMYVIEYVVSGKGYIEAKGSKSAVKAGDIYMIDCRIPHRYYADRDEPFEKKWMNLRGRYINAMAPLLLGDNPYVVMPLGEEAERHMERMHDRIRRTSSADSEQMLTELMRWLFELYMMMERYRCKATESLARLDRIVRYIEQNVCLDIRVRDLTEYFYISSSTLYRLFMNAYGMSPKDFILYKKVEAAKRLIVDGELTIHAIAAVLKFYDTHHFFRVFRQYTKISPTAYRDLAAHGATEEIPQ